MAANDVNIKSDAGDLAPITATAGLLRTIRIGSFFLICAFGAAGLLQLDGAVIASGQILVEGRSQPVQSFEAGVIMQTFIQNGDLVEAGDILIALDPTLPQARLDVANERLASALAEDARLTAEAMGLAQPDFSVPALPFFVPDLSLPAARQQALFETRSQQRSEARQRLAETDTQLLAQIDGLLAQSNALEQEAHLLAMDLNRQERLMSQGLTRNMRVNELRRETAALNARRAGVVAEMARLEGARREAALMFAQQESRRGEEVAQALRDVGIAVQEMKAEIISLSEVISRTELRAPVSGVVHELSSAGPGTVVAAGMTMLQVVPVDRALEIEAMVDPRDIDNLYEGQQAEVMLSASSPRSLPKLPATVIRIPPTTMTLPETGQNIYKVVLAVASDDFPEGENLRSGMAVQVFMATGERSLLSWLVAPLIHPMAQAMREQ